MIPILEFDKLAPEDILNRDIQAEENVSAAVDAVLAEVKAQGDAALKAYTARGKATPPTATVFRTMEGNGFRCSVCGYVYESETLPKDFVCPLCRATADKFVKQD